MRGAFDHWQVGGIQRPQPCKRFVPQRLARDVTDRPRKVTDRTFGIQ